jgi:excisionase family DNA binding protein
MILNLTKSGENPTEACKTVTVEEAGRLLGVSRGTAYMAAKTGELPTIRIRGRLLVPRVQLDRMLGLPATGGGTDEEGPSLAASPSTSGRGDVTAVLNP